MCRDVRSAHVRKVNITLCSHMHGAGARSSKVSFPDPILILVWEQDFSIFKFQKKGGLYEAHVSRMEPELEPAVESTSEVEKLIQLLNEGTVGLYLSLAKF